MAEQRAQGNTNIVDVNCEIKESDYRNYFFYTRLKKDRWLVPGICTLFALFIIFQLIGHFATTLYSILFLAFGCALTGAPILNWMSYKRAAGGDKDVRISVSAAGLYIEDFTNDTNAIYAWEDIERYAQNGKLHLFYLNPSSAIIIPKRALSADQQKLVAEYAATV